MKYLKLIGLTTWGISALLVLVGSYKFDFFDSALNLAAQNYARLGLVPYRDFAVVYPPGTFLFFGQILHAESLTAARYFSALFYSLFIFIIWREIVSWRNTPLNNIEIFVTASSQAVLLRLFGFGGLNNILIVILLMVSVMNLNAQFTKRRLLLVGLVSLIVPWVRWDWALLCAAVAGFQILQKGRWLRGSMLAILGISAGFALLARYLEAIGVRSQAYDFIVTIPFALAGGYRDLPLPSILNWKSPSSMIYVLIGLFATIVWKSRKKTDNRSLILFSAGFLPYALGRSDFGHFVPLWLGVILLWLLSDIEIRDLKAVRWLSVLIFIPIMPWFIYNSNYFIPDPGLAERFFKDGNAECKSLVDTNMKTIFVGRTQYDRYRYNIVSLYAGMPELRPATKFITDEPGLQNDCHYGEIIAGELTQAEKPMITFLDINSHNAENEKMKTMRSCGKIEQYLNRSSYTIVGFCRAYDSTHEVRVYH